jgi:hypothetical protein
MPNILYPNVPNYPGVPMLNRPIGFNLSETSTSLNFPAPTAANDQDSQSSAPLTVVLAGNPVWGIFDQHNNQIGIAPGSNATLSCISLDFVRETRVASFPIENGGFSSYDKAQQPANPKVILAIDGAESDRTYLLDAIDAACIAPDLFNVVTPTETYMGYTIERYSYSRKASRGVTLLSVEVSLKEVRQVQPNFTAAAPIIVDPQNPSATPTEQNGNTQPAAPEQSTLLQAANKGAGMAAAVATSLGGN